jgi:cytochrome c
MASKRLNYALLVVVALASQPRAEEPDPARGSELFPIRCGECHATTDVAEKKIGPRLKGLIGRTSGRLEGYQYSDAMKAAGIVWSEETLKTYPVAPRKMVPGTKMNFNGLKRPGEVDDIVGYLLEAAS